MSDEQTIEEISPTALLERALRMHIEGWRLAHASCTRLVADQEVNYSFDREGKLYMADAFGFESLFMQSFRIREKIVDILEEMTGGKIILGVCKVGGTRRDVDNESLSALVQRVNDLAEDMHRVSPVFIEDDSVKHRLVGVGAISKEHAHELGCVGPTMRPSGIAQDARMLGYAAYGEVDFEPVIETAGDSYARCQGVNFVFRGIPGTLGLRIIVPLEVCLDGVL